MLAKEYKIEFLNYWVTESEFKFIPTKNMTSEQVKSIPINVDFDILIAKRKKKFKIILTINTESRNEYPYNFYVKSESLFLLKDKTDEFEFGNLVLRAALPLAISYTRVYISNNSAYSPLKRYMLPVFDVNSLIDEKVKLFQKNQTDDKKKADKLREGRKKRR